jgi:hypothetical protein
MVTPVAEGGPAHPARRTALGRCILPRMVAFGYRIVPGHVIEIEIQQANGARALVTGTLDRVPVAAGGEALRLVITNATVAVLPAASGE